MFPYTYIVRILGNPRNQIAKIREKSFDHHLQQQKDGQGLFCEAVSLWQGRKVRKQQGEIYKENLNIAQLES